MRYASRSLSLESEMLQGGFNTVHLERIKEEFKKQKNFFEVIRKNSERKKIIWKDFDTQQPVIFYLLPFREIC